MGSQEVHDPALYRESQHLAGTGEGRARQAAARPSRPTRGSLPQGRRPQGRGLWERRSPGPPLIEPEVGKLDANARKRLVRPGEKPARSGLAAGELNAG